MNFELTVIWEETVATLKGVVVTNKFLYPHRGTAINEKAA